MGVRPNLLLLLLLERFDFCLVRQYVDCIGIGQVIFVVVVVVIVECSLICSMTYTYGIYISMSV